jgi:hypothetical protein
VRRSVKFNTLLTVSQPRTDNLDMKVKTTIETVEKVWNLLKDFDAGTEQFLDELPTRDKITILALAMMVRSDYEDFEEAYYAAERKVRAKDLTKHLIDDNELQYKLQDVVQIAKRDGWEMFEAMWVEHTSDGDDDETN